MSIKSPREYAQDIIALPDKAARQQALNNVPEHFQALTKALVVDYFTKRKFNKRGKS